MLEDFRDELRRSRPAREAATDYRDHVQHGSGGSEGPDFGSLFALFEAMARASGHANTNGQNGDAHGSRVL